MQGGDFQRERGGTVQTGQGARRFEIGIVLLDRGRIHQRVRRRIPGGETGTVLRKQFDPLRTECLEQRGVFGFVHGAVAAGDAAAERTRHLRESAHADAADADEMQ